MGWVVIAVACLIEDFGLHPIYLSEAPGGVRLARLSDVGGDMVSSLASSEDFRRKVERRIG